jgi:hypothetical protein
MKRSMNFSSTLSYISVCCQKTECCQKPCRWQSYEKALDET